jgi:hypothetical protein
MFTNNLGITAFAAGKISYFNVMKILEIFTYVYIINGVIEAGGGI